MTKTCPECRSADVDEEASRCPHCRHVFANSRAGRERLVLRVALGVVIVAVFVAFVVHKASATCAVPGVC